MPESSNRVLSALRIADPPAWRAKVRDALRAEGTVPGAAKVLGVGRTTLFRWLDAEPALREGIDLPDKPGPLPGTPRAKKS